jgi:hypothetical protein
VTVCVAAICDNYHSVVGASDKMLTSIAEFESLERKVFRLTESVVVMWAGDSGFLRGILNEVGAEVDARRKADPGARLEVLEAAQILQKHYNAAWTYLIDQHVLAPFGLTTSMFRRVQRNMSEGLVNDLAMQMRSHRAPGIAALIIGMDSRLAHIYEFHNNTPSGAGEIRCHDAVGFHAIGSGDFQALSQLMAIRHGPTRGLPDALFFTYLAKKRAQVAPGVGVFTDMFYFDSEPGTPGVYKLLPLADKNELEEEIKTVLAQEWTMLKAARDRFWAWHDLQPPIPPPPEGPSGPITGTGEIQLPGLSVTGTGTVTPPGASGPTAPTGGQEPR